MMSGLYIIVGLIVLASAVFVLIGVGMLTKYLLRTSDDKWHKLYYRTDDIPNFILGAFMMLLLMIAIGLIVAVSYPIGRAIVNAIA
jgi:hypothetical protein